MKLSALLAPLIAAKVPHEVIMQTVQAWEAEQGDALERRRASDRERQERHRHVKSRDSHVTVPSRAGVTRVEDITSNLEIAGQEENKKENARDARSPVSGFLDFWALFPNKVGKRDAEKAFATAIRRAPLEAIMAGLRRYVAKTDDRPWCNPATFLNQNRWEDQPAAVPPRQATAPPPNKRRNYVDVALDRMNGHGSASIFGDSGDVERLPAGQQQPGRDDGPVRSGLARRFLPGSH